MKCNVLLLAAAGVLCLGGLAAAQTCVAPPSGMVGWWPAEGDSNDLTNANPGTPLGTVRYAQGHVGRTFLLDGSSEIDVPDAPALNLQAMTIMAWVYPADISGDGRIVLNKEVLPLDNNIQYEIGIRGDSCSEGDCGGIPAGHFMFFIGGVNGLPSDFDGWADTGGAAPLNNWTHIAVTYDGTSAVAYVNGFLARTITPVTGPVAVTSGTLRIGSRVGLSPLGRFIGAIDETQIYNRALTASEISAIVRAQSAGVCKPGTIVNGASRKSGPLAPNSIASVFGIDMASAGEATLLSAPPSSLGGASIMITDSTGSQSMAPLVSTSAGQLDFVVPDDVRPGPAQLQVLSSNGVQTGLSAQIKAAAPGLFSANGDGAGVAAGQAIRRSADGTTVTEPLSRFDARSARYVPAPVSVAGPGDLLYLNLYGTGIRGYSSSLSVQVGGQHVGIVKLTPDPEFTGRDVIQVGPLPKTMAGQGEMPIAIQADDATSNNVTVVLCDGVRCR